MKLKKLIEMISFNEVFGEVSAWMYSVEFQKRGLAHAHILVWLKATLRLENIDELISAEIPDKEKDPVLYDIVTKNMIHGPCGSINPS